MRRPICWKEKDENGKTEIRVSIHASKFKWQYKRKGEEWDYDTPPREDQLDRLEQELQNRYQRGDIAAGKLRDALQKQRREGN